MKIEPFIYILFSFSLLNHSFKSLIVFKLHKSAFCSDLVQTEREKFGLGLSRILLEYLRVCGYCFDD